VAPWLIALGLAGRVDVYHGLPAVVAAVTLSAREADAQNLQRFDPLKGTYAELVSMYEAGHRVEAVRWLTWWPASHFRTGIENLARDPNLRRVKVAIVMHTDVATSADVGRDGAAAHLAIIHPLVHALSDPRRFGGAADQFIRRWYVVAVSTMMARGDRLTALQYIGKAAHDFPTDKSVRFWQGYVEEMRTHWQAAESAYWRAVEYDPAYAEARLRLGWVLLQRGDYDQSRRQLELVRDATNNLVLKYLAHLFLGKSREHDNDFTGAARDYEAALAIGPFCQTAYVALSLAEERAGNHAKAQEITARFAVLAKSDVLTDPWWLFKFHDIDRDALQWLHDAVQ
jgi:tetratricopeptide (TPR) repeat protein